MVLYGRPKIGKTLICTQLPGAININLEPNSGAAMYNCARVHVRDFNALVNTIVSLRGMKECRFIVIDNVGELEGLCDTAAVADYRALTDKFTGKSMTEVPNGYGYRYIRNRFEEVIDLLFQCPAKIIFLGHVRDKLLGEKESTDVSQAEIDLSMGVSRMLCTRADAIIHLSAQKRKKDKDGKPLPIGTPIITDLVACTKPLKGEVDNKGNPVDNTINAGTRFDYLHNKEFVLSPGDTKIAAWAEIFPELKAQ